MTLKDFFRVLLKLFGLYFVVAVVFTVIPGLMLSFAEIDIKILLVMIATLLVIVAVFLFLVFLPDKIVTFLQLDRGFDSPVISFEKMDDITLLKFGTIIIGGFVVVDNISPFLLYGYQLFKGSVKGDMEHTLFGANDIKQNFALNALNLLIGYLLLTNYNAVGNWLDRRNPRD